MLKIDHDHPAEEALERFLLHHSRQEELELLEIHILGCEACVNRLEKLEPEIAATKLALEHLLAYEPLPTNRNLSGSRSFGISSPRGAALY